MKICEARDSKGRAPRLPKGFVFAGYRLCLANPPTSPASHMIQSRRFLFVEASCRLGCMHEIDVCEVALLQTREAKP